MFPGCLSNFTFPPLVSGLSRAWRSMKRTTRGSRLSNTKAFNQSITGRIGCLENLFLNHRMKIRFTGKFDLLRQIALILELKPVFPTRIRLLTHFDPLYKPFVTNLFVWSKTARPSRFYPSVWLPAKTSKKNNLKDTVIYLSQCTLVNVTRISSLGLFSV